MVLLALGVATIVFLLLFTAQTQDRLERDAKGIDLVVGAKGSPLQLILSSVYHVDIPTGNIPLKDAEAHLDASAGGVSDAAGARRQRAGLSHRRHRRVVPHALRRALARGKPFADEMEAVLGAEAARRAGLDVGSALHRAPRARGRRRRRTASTRSGRRRARAAPAPRSTGWCSPRWRASGTCTRAHGGGGEREVTALLVKYPTPVAALQLPRFVNATTSLQAASPAYEGARLMSLVGAGVETLRVFALVLMASAALSVLIALTSALEERRYDLALLRTLGARPAQLLALSSSKA